jgi:hypothetical protein
MNTLEPLKLNSIVCENIIFRKPKIIKNKKIIFIKYKNKSKETNFVVQLSKLINTNIIKKKTIELKVTKDEDIKYLNSLDDFIIDQIKNNNINQQSYDNTLPIKYNKILDDNNMFKINLFDNDDFKTNILLNNEKINSLNNIISQNSTSKIMLEIFAIRITDDSISLLLKLIYISIKYDNCNLNNYKFIKDSDSESEYEFNEETECETINENILNNDLFIKNNVDITSNIVKLVKINDKLDSTFSPKTIYESSEESAITSVTSSNK